MAGGKQSGRLAYTVAYTGTPESVGLRALDIVPMTFQHCMLIRFARLQLGSMAKNGHESTLMQDQITWNELRLMLALIGKMPKCPRVASRQIAAGMYI